MTSNNAPTIEMHMILITTMPLHTSCQSCDYNLCSVCL